MSREVFPWLAAIVGLLLGLFALLGRASEPATIAIYQARIDQMQARIDLQSAENAELRARLMAQPPPTPGRLVR